MGPAFIRAKVGVIPALRLATHADMRRLTGLFFGRCQLAPDVADPELAETFWAAREEMRGERWPGADQRFTELVARSHG
jgi:hypothetical protein